MRRLCLATLLFVACTRSNPAAVGGGGGGSGGGDPPVADAGGTGGAGVPDLGGAGSVADMAPPPVAKCYSEDFSPTSLMDLAASYAPQKWKASSLEALERRLPNAYYLMNAMKDDPQLPQFVDAGSWPALMMSLMTMCHEETHGYDYDGASVDHHLYYMRPDLSVTPPKLQTFARSEILGYIHDTVTRNYDDTYLTGTQGTYDLVALADELNAYENGLTCIAAMSDYIGSGISATDGVAAHLYYLELYLKRARTAHAAVYASLKASPDWQKFVRYAWARGLFWRKVAAPYKNLTINDAPIWAKVDAADNASEIEQFTGRTVADLACTP